MKVRKGDRVEWAKLPGRQFEVAGFDNRDVVIVEGSTIRYTVPARELTVVEKRVST